MKKYKLLLISLFVFVSILLVAAAPEAASTVPLTIENRSTDYVTLQLTGHKWYYLYVKPGETKTFTIERSTNYDQRFYSCGIFRDPGWDLSKKLSVVVPRCGDEEYKFNERSPKVQNAKVDASEMYKIVRVRFDNTTDHNLIILLTEGEAYYAFYIPEGESRVYTINRDDYVIEQYGCPTFTEFDWHAQQGKVKKLVCP